MCQKKIQQSSKTFLSIHMVMVTISQSPPPHATKLNQSILEFDNRSQFWELFQSICQTMTSYSKTMLFRSIQPLSDASPCIISICIICLGQHLRHRHCYYPATNLSQSRLMARIFLKNKLRLWDNYASSGDLVHLDPSMHLASIVLAHNDN